MVQLLRAQAYGTVMPLTGLQTGPVEDRGRYNGYLCVCVCVTIVTPILTTVCVTNNQQESNNKSQWELCYTGKGAQLIR